MFTVIEDDRALDDFGRPYYMMGGIVDALLDGKEPTNFPVAGELAILQEDVPWEWRATPVVVPDPSDGLPPLDVQLTIRLLDTYLTMLPPNAPAPERYRERLRDELVEAQKPHVQRVIVSAIEAYDRVQEKYPEIVIGVGRGSACASLILFLHGVHLVDPVLYDIPMKEFYKEAEA